MLRGDHEDGNDAGMIQTHPSARPGSGVARGRPLVLAVVLISFALFYPYLDAAGLCGAAGCPHFLQSHAPAAADLPSATLAAVEETPPPETTRSFNLLPASDRRPAQVYAAPDPEPPRP